MCLIKHSVLTTQDKTEEEREQSCFVGLLIEEREVIMLEDW